ncbi:Zinc finger protein 385D [Cricetulus griseus]|uniref:Zinc finger protein 385D n=1 Tax=Cricetulus griseus TaxID=10029 RepID=G3H1E9_CRIGR|nr:Zinc finger protein 385D [Cricetulus griseus]
MKNKQKSVTAKDSAKTTFTSITTNTMTTSSDKTVVFLGKLWPSEWPLGYCAYDQLFTAKKLVGFPKPEFET